jgi:cytochrome c peroxidase
LGHDLFNDKALSPSGEVSCERCHQTERNFTDGSETATGGVGGATRNTPSVVLAAWQRWQLWDGRADTLWMQALLPFENPNEFGSSRLFVAHRVYAQFRDAYEALFGPLPMELGFAYRFPVNGKPGDAAYDTLSPADQETITRIFVNVGKCIAAYERSFRAVPAPLDRYALGDRSALTDAQKDGLRSFFETGCAQCHWGPRLTDDSFHVIRFPTGRHDFAPDDGRIRANDSYGPSEFRADGKWSDAKQPPRQMSGEQRLLGSFKTPALRGVAVTAPYGHGGSVPSLLMAVDLHRTQGMPVGSQLTEGVVDPWLAPFESDRNAGLVALLQTMGLGR